jgi:transposase
MAMGRLSNRLKASGTGSRLAVDLSPRHAFYDWCNEVLAEFDERCCASRTTRMVLAARRSLRGATSACCSSASSRAWSPSARSPGGALIPCRCIAFCAWRTARRCPTTRRVTRSRLPLEVHHAVFGLLLEIADKHALVKGKRIGVDASTQEAALRRLVRRDTGEDYQERLRRLAQESGLETPSAEDLIRFDRARKNKTLSNADWVSPTDPEARIARMKDGTTHLAYKPEHAVDLDTGVIVAARIHRADQGDTHTLAETLEQAEAMLDLVGLAPTPETPAEMIADTGYHAREGLKALEGSAWKSRISEKEPKAFARWHGDAAARRYNNRARLKSTVARQAFKLRAEKVERSFAFILDIGGLRRTWLRGAGNVEKRYLIQVAAHNLVIRHRFGAGTPRQATALFWLVSDECQGRGLAIWTILTPSRADQRTTAGASPVVLICLFVFSI